MFQTLDSDNRYKPLRLYSLITKSLIIYMRNLGDIKVTWLMGDKASLGLKRGQRGCYRDFLEVLIEASYINFRRKNHTTSLIFQAQFPSTSS